MTELTQTGSSSWTQHRHLGGCLGWKLPPNITKTQILLTDRIIFSGSLGYKKNRWVMTSDTQVIEWMQCEVNCSDWKGFWFVSPSGGQWWQSICPRVSSTTHSNFWSISTASGSQRWRVYTLILINISCYQACSLQECLQRRYLHVLMHQQGCSQWWLSQMLC